MSAKRGSQHYAFKTEKFHFKNKKTGEMFYGTRYDFYTAFNLHCGNVSQLVLGKINEIKGWMITRSK